MSLRTLILASATTSVSQTMGGNSAQPQCDALYLTAAADVRAAPAQDWAGYYSLAPPHWCGGRLASVCGSKAAYYQHYCPNASALPDPSACLQSHYVYFAKEETSRSGKYVLSPILGSLDSGDWLLAADPMGDAGVVLPFHLNAVTAASAGAVPVVAKLQCVSARQKPPLCQLYNLGASVPRENLRASVRARWVPHLVPQESAASIIAAAEVQSRESRGWQADRHAAYQTTDLDALAHPALKRLVKPVVEKITARLLQAVDTAPELSSAAMAGIEFSDVFVVKYASTGQRSLALHVDGSVITFQLALNGAGPNASQHVAHEQYDGGGTYFKALDCRAISPAGTALVFAGDMLHGGVEIDGGVRYLLVGFGLPNSGTHRQRTTVYDAELHGVDFGAPFKVAGGEAGSSATDPAPWLTEDGVLHLTVWWQNICSRSSAAACSEENYSVHVRTESTSNALNSEPLRRVGIVWVVRRPWTHEQTRSVSNTSLYPRHGDAPVALPPPTKDCNVKWQSAKLVLRLPSNGSAFVKRHTHILFAYPPGHSFVSALLKPAMAQQKKPAFFDTDNV
eukprot:SAG31_NODE_239_length_19453_cov_5.539888_2_plen_566_part_00